MKKLAFIPLTLFVVLVVFLMIGLRRDPREVPSPLINKAAPSFQLPQLHDPSKTFSAADMRGKVWLLNFWGTWCIACREEHPWLIEYAKTNAVPIVGVDYKYSTDPSDERTAAIRWLVELGNPYSMTVYDADGRTSIDYGVYGAPETFVIDKEGIIRFKQIGPLNREAWQNKVLPLVNQLNQ